MQKPNNTDEYITGFTEETQKKLEQVRTAIKKAAPQAEEAISYGMPAYKMNGILVYFAGYANHIGFYPTPSAIEAFKKELSIYKSSKGAVQFPVQEPMPIALITKIVKFRVNKNLEKVKEQQK